MRRHWLLMFHPDTYKLVQQHHTIGVLGRYKQRFHEVTRGDPFVVYVSRQQCFDAYGKIESDAFQDTKPIFGPRSERYVWRRTVKLQKTGFARDGRKLLYGVSVFKGTLTTTPANMVNCCGGFLAISEEDYTWLVDCMEGRVQPEWEHASG